MKELLEQYLIRIDKLGGDSRQLVFEKPATNLDITDIENKLTYQMPSDFTNILLTLSSHCEFKWFLPDDFTLPDQLRQILWRVTLGVELRSTIQRK